MGPETVLNNYMKDQTLGCTDTLDRSLGAVCGTVAKNVVSGVWDTWVHAWILRLSSYVTLGQLLNFLKPQVSHL